MTFDCPECGHDFDDHVEGPPPGCQVDGCDCADTEFELWVAFESVN